MSQIAAALLMFSDIGQSGVVYAAPQTESERSALSQDSKSIPEWFATANQMFVAGNFREAQVWYEKVASRCKGTELCIQCEYFAAISAWNLGANEAAAKSIEAWLLSAKSYEQRVTQSGGKIVSPSWGHWVQSAQIVLSQWEASQQRFDTAKNYLNQAIKESENAGHGAPRIHYEMGQLHARHLKDPIAALGFLDKAFESVGSDRQLKTKILLAKARGMMESNDLTGANDCLRIVAKEELSNEQRVETKLLESRILFASATDTSSTVKSAAFWEGAVEAALNGQVEPVVLAELASILRTAGLDAQSSQILTELIRVHPNHVLSGEARVHLAYQAASQKDWQQVQDLTLAAIEAGRIDQWSTYAMYLNAKAKIELGQTDDGVSLLSSLLEEPSLSDELKTTIHLDLAQTHYMAEAWDKMSTHVEILSSLDAHSKQPTAQSPRIRMWNAELLAHQGKWDEAERIVSAIRNDFPEWNRRIEVDYLLSRCLIARADFESARTILHAIVMQGAKDIGLNASQFSTLAARAAWMIGETYMMQQRYEEASQAYSEVLQFRTESFWCAASITQRGLCAEQLNRLQEAKEFYEKVIADYSASPFAETARTRLSGISLSTKQVERIGSGTKR
ncbi:MAG: tetratricopeptide repeat protein [Pirellula sp.]|nr:tetratricopeptide repeat protein [Pirellula sp.]